MFFLSILHRVHGGPKKGHMTTSPGNFAPTDSADLLHGPGQFGDRYDRTIIFAVDAHTAVQQTSKQKILSAR